MKKTETSLHEPNEQKTPFEAGRQLCARVREPSAMLDPQTNGGIRKYAKRRGLKIVRQYADAGKIQTGNHGA